MKLARVFHAVGAAAITLMLALSLASACARAEAPTWRLERVLPPQLPGESEAQHDARYPIGLGKIGDIEFWAPNKGLLITDGDPPTVPPGVWSYDGQEWHELASVCGASDGRIAWAGADDFWTVSDGRPGQASNERPPPLEDNTLCHFKAEGGAPLAVVNSYASLAFRANSYQAMHAAACLSPSDCWFGGELLPEPEPGANTEFGAFQLHWNGSTVSEDPYPAEHPIEDMREVSPSGGSASTRYLFESVRLRSEDHLLESESPSAPPDLHLITPIGVQPTFISLSPGVPRYAPEERPYALGFLHLASDEEALWGAANPASPTPAESAPAEVTIVRYSGGVWSQVLGYGSDPPAGNPFTQATRDEGENETVSSIAAEPGAPSAWLALTSPNNELAARGGAASAIVASVSAAGEVSERQTLPAAGEGVGPKGAADQIVCPAAGDCWLTTTQGWLFHYSDEAQRTLPGNGDSSFANPITFRPPDEGIPAVVPDAPPVDDSGLLGEVPQSFISAPENTAPPELRIPEALVSDVRTRIVHGTKLELTFQLAAEARVRLLAERRKKVVASTPMRKLAAGNRQLLLALNRNKWPTKLDLQAHALAPIPTTPTRSPNVSSVSTGLVVLPKTPSFPDAGTLP